MSLGHVDEAQHVAQLRVVRRRLDGLRHPLQRGVGLASLQRHHAFHHRQLRMVGCHALGEAVDPFGLVEVAARQRELGLREIGAELVRVEHGGLVQRRLGVARAPATHQHAGPGKVEFGIFRCQGDGAVDARQCRVGLAVLQLGGGEPAHRLGIVGPFGHKGLGSSQCIGRRATAQGFEDRVVHGTTSVRTNADCTGGSGLRQCRWPGVRPPSARHIHRPRRSR